MVAKDDPEIAGRSRQTPNNTPSTSDTGATGDGDPTPVANLRPTTPGSAERPHEDNDAQPGPRRKPFTISNAAEPPPGNKRDTRDGMSASDRRRKFWWSKLFIGTVVWDIVYLVVLPWLAGTYPELGSVSIPDDIRAFTNTVTAIVTAGVILSVTELPLLPWSAKQRRVG